MRIIIRYCPHVASISVQRVRPGQRINQPPANLNDLLSLLWERTEFIIMDGDHQWLPMTHCDTDEDYNYVKLKSPLSHRPTSDVFGELSFFFLVLIHFGKNSKPLFYDFTLYQPDPTIFLVIGCYYYYYYFKLLTYNRLSL